MPDQANDVTQLRSWYSLAAAAAAAAGLVGGGNSAEAAQMVVHPVGGPVLIPGSATSQGTIYFDLLDTTGTKFGTIAGSGSPGGSADFGLAWAHEGNASAIFAASVNSMGAILTGASSGAAAKLPSNAHIGATQFAGHSGSSGMMGSDNNGTQTGPWLQGDTGFLGLEVPGASSTTIYGWAEIKITSQSGHAFQPELIAWGFNTTPEQDAVTPSLPEPSSLVLLASGAVGLAAYRRRSAQRRRASGKGA